jgi:hypothetical protein
LRKKKANGEGVTAKIRQKDNLLYSPELSFYPP